MIISFWVLLGSVMVSCTSSSNNMSPTIEIISPKENMPYVKPFSATAMVSDVDNTPTELQVRWLADERELCGWLPPDLQGKSQCEIRLQQMEKTIVVEVRDPQKSTSSAKIDVLKNLVTEKVKKPDIVLVVVDTLRADRLDIHGNTQNV